MTHSLMHSHCRPRAPWHVAYEVVALERLAEQGALMEAAQEGENNRPRAGTKVAMELSCASSVR
jgi:hypothetical protein